MILISLARVWCILFCAITVAARPSFCRAHPKNSDGINSFNYLPALPPDPAISTKAPLQFNGSYPGQGTVPGQLGWWTTPVTDHTVDLISFVQYNRDAGVVFWIQRTLFEVYLAPVTKKTYAVKLGQPWTESPDPGLAGKWTVTRLSRRKYAFGWEGDYKSWFVCEKGKGYYALYFGEVLEGCGKHFVLHANYL